MLLLMNSVRICFTRLYLWINVYDYFSSSLDWNEKRSNNSADYSIFVFNK